MRPIFLLLLLPAFLLHARRVVAAPTDNGYVRVSVSATQTLVGVKVTIKGFSLLYGSLKSVTMTITGPINTPAQNLPLVDSGSFSTTWAPTAPGKYKITVKSSDGKAQESVDVTAYAFVEMDMITGPTREDVKTAADKLKTAVDQVKHGVSSNDANTLDQQFTAFNKRKEAFTKVLDDIDKAGKGLDALEKQYGKLPDAVTEGVAKLNDAFSDLHQHMTQANGGGGNSSGGQGGGNTTSNTGTGKPDHSSYDNTVCEYLVMASEACALFSTITTFYAKIDVTIVNLASGTVAPAAAGALGSAAKAGDNTNIVIKEAAKLFSYSLSDNNSFKNTMSQASFANDIAQTCSKLLMNKYCAIMDGDLTENYQCTFRNNAGNVWWQYRYNTGATISLRYPKGSSSGGILKMKGNIEGNATKFEIYQDASEIDDFKTAAKGRVKLYSVCVYAPPSVPFVSSRADKTTGFGAVARGVTTPAYFNIPIDADYNVDAGTVKIYVNPALVDFSPSVQYIFCYLTLAAGLPLSSRVNFPINRVRPTLGKVMGDNDTFPVKIGTDSKLTIAGTGTTDIGKGTAIAHKIYFSFSMRSE